MLPELGVTHALLLQGPAGPFMRRFGQELREHHIRVTKVNFHAGDVLYYPGPDAVPFRGHFDELATWLENLMEARGIDGIFVFGDCRPIHREAIRVARSRGAKVWCFEEGYLRPHYITLEEHGVNGHSQLPRDPEFYRGLELPPPEEPLKTGPRYGRLAWHSTVNALAFTLLNQGFPHYRHHRILNAWYHTFVHVRSVVRKELFLRQEAPLLERFRGELSGRYFFVPLQVHCDFQLHHSRFDNVLDFATEVAETFVAHAPPDTALVFKHHPMDRAYREYGDVFASLRRRLDLEDRLFYCHDLDLDTIIDHARGTITINSTVGLMSVGRGTPAMALGTAIYDLPGITHQGSLTSFLHDPEPIDTHLYEQLTRYLIATNQYNGSYYRRIESLDSPTGVSWRKSGAQPERARFSRLPTSRNER